MRRAQGDYLLERAFEDLSELSLECCVLCMEVTVSQKDLLLTVMAEEGASYRYNVGCFLL